MFSNDNNQLYTSSQEQISERILSKRIYSLFGGLIRFQLQLRRQLKILEEEERSLLDDNDKENESHKNNTKVRGTAKRPKSLNEKFKTFYITQTSEVLISDILI